MPKPAHLHNFYNDPGNMAGFEKLHSTCAHCYMFTAAIEEASQYTRPMHFIDRYYGSTTVRPGAATFFFVNEEGVAVTCKHVAQFLVQSEQLRQRFSTFREQKANVKDAAQLEALARSHGFTPEQSCELYIQLMGCAQSFSGVNIIFHPKYDLAILKLQQPVNLQYTGFARFCSDMSTIKQGSFLCRLGFPFPEFNNFRYNEAQDGIEWTSTGITGSPSFPIEGMVTRFMSDGQIYGIELSTPGLRGQSGGPLFNAAGHVCGMQFATAHLHLGFDMKEKEVIAGGEKIVATNQPFLHVGQCIHADVITAFLGEHGIRYHLAS